MSRCLATLVVFMGFLLTSPAAEACGDKFLIVGRCVSFQRLHTAQHPGNVLILWSSDTQAGNVLRDVKIQNYLQKAGHHVNVMEESGNIADAIRSGGYNVVVCEGANADRLRLDLVGSPTRVLPVLFQATDTEMDKARQNYRHALNVKRAPLQRSRLLDALDGAMR